MMDLYLKAQQEMMQNQEMHTSTEEVAGPSIDVDALNEDWDDMDVNPVIEDVEVVSDETKTDINIEDVEIVVDNTINVDENANNNQ